MSGPILLVVIALGAIFAVVLSFGFRRRGPGPMAGFLFFAALFILVSWAGLAWLRPAGPLLWGIAWLPLIGLGLFMLLLLVAFLPVSRSRDEIETVRPDGNAALRQEARANAAGLWVSVSLMLGLLALAIVAAYTA